MHQGWSCWWLLVLLCYQWPSLEYAWWPVLMHAQQLALMVLMLLTVLMVLMAPTVVMTLMVLLMTVERAAEESRVSVWHLVLVDLLLSVAPSLALIHTSTATSFAC